MVAKSGIPEWHPTVSGVETGQHIAALLSPIEQHLWTQLSWGEWEAEINPPLYGTQIKKLQMVNYENIW